ncbi:DUF3100 domain-containing protein [Halomonas sp. ND22Bw]|uniref:DUF3100 domain-containing protein n=1 Tax=Halomonas salina TaxID=42565 RepID=A0ABR4WR92_9GAMM|nr:DUF3100 domain-containing protein [Halomonas salina]KGE77251.1 hypothetical protein FP66_11025 [Halomonas salina]PSJ23017.1 DUF3100 domain-containing protein [Halomonas sp. ND22Bw]
MPLSRLLDWRLHALVIVIALVSEFVGIQKVPLGPGTLLLLPLFYAFILGVLFNHNVTRTARRFIPERISEAAGPLILLSIMPFIARFGSTIGPAIEDLVQAGPALILQEFGNLGTMLIAMPLAVVVLKMGREAIGATYSIAREPNIAVISDKYGLKGPEGIGVMGIYVVGTMFGTLWFALMAGYLTSLDIFDPRALAMACGVGSGSMVAACSAAIAGTLPELKDELLAFSGASNLMTYATGLYLSLFIALPAAEKLYSLLKGQREAKPAGAQVAPSLNSEEMSQEERPESNLPKTALAMAAACAVAWVANTVNGAGLIAALPGMLILYGMTMTGLIITRFSPFYLPGVAWVSLVSIVMTLPFFPGNAWLTEQLSAVNFLAIVTPVLAYAGLALTKRELAMFREAGWKLVVIALLVFTGTFLSSALIADLFL